MSDISETMHGGLSDALDPSVMSPGALAKAQNSRYRPGDSALWQSEGRRAVAGGGHGENEGVLHLAGLAFDSFLSQELDEDEPDVVDLERHKIVYGMRTQPTTLYTIPAKRDYSNADMAEAEATAHTLPVPLGQYPLIAVGHENAHALLTGAHTNLWVDLDPNFEIGRHGMPLQTVSPRVDFASSGDTVAYSYWVTFYDSETGVEGASNEYTTIELGAVVSSDPEIFLLKSDLDAIMPSEATHLFVYRSAGQENTYPLAFPYGYRIAEVELATITLETIVEAPDILIYYQVFEDTFVAFPNDSILDNNLGAYEMTTTRVEGLEVAYSRNEPPPGAFTGDNFQGSLVLNDVLNPQHVAYSIPSPIVNSAHYFPSVYRFVFETEDVDEVRCIKRIGGHLGVWLNNSIWRINWLPRSSAIDFSAGKAVEMVSPDRGTVGPRAVCTFTPEGSVALAAFINPNGVYFTDLFRVRKMSGHIDWRKVLLQGDVYGATLTNDIPNERLAMTIGDVMYYFHYDEIHFQDSRSSITGPIQRPAGILASDLVQLEGGGHQLVNSNSKGGTFSIFYENLGFEDDGDTSTPLVWSALSREIYPFGAGHEGRTEAFHVHVRPTGAGAGSWQGELTLRTKLGNVIKPSDPITFSERRLEEVTMNQLFESFQFGIEGSSAPDSEAGMSVNFVGCRFGHLQGARRT